MIQIARTIHPAFASETRGPMGYMRDYAIRIKAEVTAGLNEAETLSLVKSAADRAKAASTQKSPHGGDGRAGN